MHLTLWLLYPYGKSPQCPMDRRLETKELLWMRQLGEKCLLLLGTEP
jgi:hypothetical protein